MKKNEEKSDKKSVRKLVSWIVLIVLVVPMTVFWSILAYIQVHKTRIPTRYNPNNNYTVTRTIAHRGFSAEYFDNTIQAFEAAGNDSFFYGMETDIRLTADGVWVCSHDDDPFEDRSVRISSSDYEEIKDLPLDLSKSKARNISGINYKICTYEDFLSICRDRNKLALIEFKGEVGADEIKDAADVALNYLPYSEIIFGSFSLPVIEEMQKADPRINTLVFSNSRFKTYCYSKMGDHVGTNKKKLTAAAIKRAHESNEFVYVYTINDAKEWKKYKEMQVDFIISNESFK